MMYASDKYGDVGDGDDGDRDACGEWKVMVVTLILMLWMVTPVIMEGIVIRTTSFFHRGNAVPTLHTDCDFLFWFLGASPF